MWALISKALLWIFAGGIKDVTNLFDKIVSLFRKTSAERKQENEKEVDDEFREIEKGERPKWDA